VQTSNREQKYIHRNENPKEQFFPLELHHEDIEEDEKLKKKDDNKDNPPKRMESETQKIMKHM
jgi:hypothetical protein